MRIGITERGDAGIDLSWADKLHTVDGAVIITKRLSRKFCETLLNCDNGRLVLHATCTGWGGTRLEPNVYRPTETLASLRRLIEAGFPKERCVLRIDPIIPTHDGLNLFEMLVRAAEDDEVLRGIRKRISVLDEYRHVKQRLRDEGLAPFYGDTSFQPSEPMWFSLENTLRDLHADYGCVFETCAEPRLMRLNCVEACGCVGAKDLSLMGPDVPQVDLNPQGRHGCLCLSCKTELLEKRHRCPNGCLYCYWKD